MEMCLFGLRTKQREIIILRGEPVFTANGCTYEYIRDCAGRENIQKPSNTHAVILSI